MHIKGLPSSFDFFWLGFIKWGVSAFPLFYFKTKLMVPGFFKFIFFSCRKIAFFVPTLERCELIIYDFCHLFSFGKFLHVAVFLIFDFIAFLGQFANLHLVTPCIDDHVLPLTHLSVEQFDLISETLDFDGLENHYHICLQFDLIFSLLWEVWDPSGWVLRIVAGW